MTRLDLFWMSNDEWYEIIDVGVFRLTDKAPQEAKESFERFLKQREEAKKRGAL